MWRWGLRLLHRDRHGDQPEILHQRLKSLGFTVPRIWDTLVALGSSASFAWSTYALFMMTDAQVRKPGRGREYMHEFYFELAMILTLITVGKC